VFAGLWAALHHPWVFVVLLVVFLLLAIWLLPRIWRAVRTAGRTLRRWFTGDAPQPAASTPPAEAPSRPPARSP